MDDDRSKQIRVIKQADVSWEEAWKGPEDDLPAGQDFTAAISDDDKFSTGLWRRERQDRFFERQYHEIAFIIEGEVEITDIEGVVSVAGPGDILITPKGSMGQWRNLSPVRKFWAIYEEPGATLNPYLGPGPF